MTWYPQIIYYQRVQNAFLQNFATFYQLLSTLYDITLRWSCLFKIIIRSSLLYFYFYVCVQKLFSASWKNLHVVLTFYSFVTEHHSNLPLVLDPCFNSSICCQLLVLSVRSQHRLEIDRLQAYLFWLK